MMATQNSNIKVQSSDKSQTSNTKSSLFDLEERMARFGENVVVFCRSLRADIVSRPLISQVVRSATSIGANYSEANNGSSKRDFRNKAFISKKEAQETKYWLRMLISCYPEREEELKTLWQEAHELTLILQAIINKVDAKGARE